MMKETRLEDERPNQNSIDDENIIEKYIRNSID